MRKTLWVVAVMATVALMIFLGCQSDASRIRATNVAIDQPNPTATSSPLSAEIRSVDIEEGDCVNSTLPEGIRIDTLDIVACNSVWKYRVVDSFEVTKSGSYPGINYFSQQAQANCDRRFTYFLYPLEDSWELGDRTVSCLQESYGLSTSDPGKLDRLVTYGSLRFGECFNDAPETRNEQVELVSCSGSWTYRVKNRIDISESGAYPGEGFFESEASQQCDPSTDFYRYPSPEAWDIGDRALLCIEEGF